MPELPEIETVKLQLARVLIGKTISAVEVRNNKTVQGDMRMVEGKTIEAVQRRAKVLLIDLSDGISMAFHFKMSGQLIYVPHPNPSTDTGEGSVEGSLSERIVGGHPTGDFVGKLPSSHTRILFHIPPATMYFNDQRMFGWVKVGLRSELEKEKFFENLGPEPWDMDEADFVTKVRRAKKAVKVVIMDQSVISGVGNIYANDALWEANINPATPGHLLSEDQARELFRRIKQVLEEGIQYGGATAADAKYIDLHGLGGHYQEHFRTYDQEGKPCMRCGQKIIKTVLGGRGTYWCPVCQA